MTSAPTSSRFHTLAIRESKAFGNTFTGLLRRSEAPSGLAPSSARSPPISSTSSRPIRNVRRCHAVRKCYRDFSAGRAAAAAAAAESSPDGKNVRWALPDIDHLVQVMRCANPACCPT